MRGNPTPLARPKCFIKRQLHSIEFGGPVKEANPVKLAQVDSAGMGVAGALGTIARAL
jgi:hypothetical protein